MADGNTRKAKNKFAIEFITSIAFIVKGKDAPFRYGEEIIAPLVGKLEEQKICHVVSFNPFFFFTGHECEFLAICSALPSLTA